MEHKRQLGYTPAEIITKLKEGEDYLLEGSKSSLAKVLIIVNQLKNDQLLRAGLKVSPVDKVIY